MAVIPENDERYLRQILLLGKGGCLVLRGLVERKRNKDGRSLEDILRSKKPKLKNCLLKFQFEYVFPTNTDVNADIETWDISLLTSIILNVFGPVAKEEKDALIKIREIRNSIQGHHPAYSLDETEYSDLRYELWEQLHQLSSGLDKDTKKKCLDIISFSGAGSMTCHFALKVLNDLRAFEPDQLSLLNERFEESMSDDKLDKVEENLNTLERNQDDRHKELTTTLNANEDDAKIDRKEIAENLNTLKRNQEDKHKELTTTLKRIHMNEDDAKIDRKKIKANSEMTVEKLGSIEKMIENILTQQTEATRVQKDVDTNFSLNSESPENAAEAQGIIVTAINDILKQIRPDMMEDSANADAINEKVTDLLTRKAGNELTNALLQLIKDILPHGHIQQARLGSIKLTIRFTTYSGILQFMQYLNSTKFQNCLKDISRALENRTGHAVTLSANIAQESLFDLHKHLADECEKLRRTRTVVLPVRCKGITDLNHIWELLQKGGADRHMKRISEILTKLVGGNVTVTTSVNRKQFEQALIEIAKPVELQMSEQAELGFAAAKRDLEKDSSSKSNKINYSGFTNSHFRTKCCFPFIKSYWETKKSTEEFDFDNASLRVNWDTDILKSLLDEGDTKKSTDESDPATVAELETSGVAKRSFAADESDDEEDWDAETMWKNWQNWKIKVKVKTTDSEHSISKEQRRIEEVLGKQIEENPVTLKPAAIYSVRPDTDRHTPIITGIELLPNDGMLLTDYRNRRLKMLDSSLKLVSYCDLPGRPWGVCNIGDGRAAVVLGDSGVQFANVSDGIDLEKEVKLDHYCSGLACFDDTLYITDRTGVVYTYTTNATQKRVLYKTQGDVSYPRIAISHDGKLIYIASRLDGLITIDNKGKHLSTLKTNTLDYAINVCVTGDGTILVCGLYPQDVLQVDQGGKCVLKKVMTLSPGLHSWTMCYDSQHSRLIVGSYDENVHVFEL